MIRLLIYGLLIYAAYRFLKSWGRSLMNRSDGADEGGPSDNTELIRDPQCGAYFLRQQGVEARIDGQRLFFCSKQCRDEYAREHGPM
jgi:hypothetical protein